MKQQVVLIHGGETFADYEGYIEYLKGVEYDPYEERGVKWSTTLQTDLGEKYEVIAPLMPSKYNAKYIEWQIWFEKVIPYLRENVILIGGSLGGIFLAKYLSEKKISVSIKSIHLVAAPYDDKNADFSLADFILPESLELLSSQCGMIHLYHSKDDFVVAFEDLEKYSELLPKAQKHIFSDRNHFLQESFPELIKNIKGT